MTSASDAGVSEGKLHSYKQIKEHGSPELPKAPFHDMGRKKVPSR